VVTSTVLDEVSQPKPPSKRGIKRESSHLSVIEERLTLGPVVVDLGDNANILVDELIINSLLILLFLEDGPKPQVFCNVVSFIEKMMHSKPFIIL
jgi:hypothetical protein